MASCSDKNNMNGEKQHFHMKVKYLSEVALFKTIFVVVDGG